MLVRQSRSTPTSPPPAPQGVVGVPERGLSTLATIGRPIYWAGARKGETYELTRTPDGRVYVRYLPAGVSVGASRPYLTVGPYPLPNAYASTKAVAARPGSARISVPGGVAFDERLRPTSVYLAFPAVGEQIEAFDLSAAVAHAAVARHLIPAVH